VVKKSNFRVEFDDDFQDALNEAASKVDDLRVPFRSMLAQFYKAEKVIFKLKTRGRYDDLSPKYKKRKKKLLGGTGYPILKRTGALEASVTKRNALGSYWRLRKKYFEVGTTLPYAHFHQFGTKKMAMREFIFIKFKGRTPGKDNTFQIRNALWRQELKIFMVQRLTGRVPKNLLKNKVPGIR